MSHQERVGRVDGIFIAPAEGAPVAALEEVRAVPGRGLEGDRYFDAAQRDGIDPSEEITLIASEGLQQAKDDGLELEPGEHRRNIVTSGVDLDGLIGRRFRVGEVSIEALEQNPPCRYLAKITGKPVVKPLARHGGVRGQILTEGIIRVGDRITDA